MAGYFDPIQIPKCIDRMDKAREALFRCRNARTISEFNSHWASFIVYTGSILHAIEAGADATPQGRQWYGGKRRIGRSDPLLTYMYQSRNEEEHGTSPTTDGVHFPMGFMDKETGEVDLTPGPTKNLVIGKGPNLFSLNTLVDKRFGTTFPPPIEHMGKPLHDNSPIAVADKYTAYLENLIDEAASLV